MPTANITVKDVLKQLEALGNENVRAHNIKWGAGDDQFGAKLGDIRALAKKIKTNHEVDAQFLGRPHHQAERPVSRRVGSDGAVRQIRASRGLAELVCR